MVWGARQSRARVRDWRVNSGVVGVRDDGFETARKGAEKIVVKLGSMALRPGL